MDTKQSVGKRIKIVRQMRRWTQEQLAEKVGLSPKYISGIERGVENPTLENVIRVAKVLGVEAYDLFLFGESDDSEKILRKTLEKMLLEADRTQLQLCFDVMRRIMRLH